MSDEDGEFVPSEEEVSSIAEEGDNDIDEDYEPPNDLLAKESSDDSSDSGRKSFASYGAYTTDNDSGYTTGGASTGMLGGRSSAL